MYNFITGLATVKNPSLVVLECGGIGYEINVPITTSSLLVSNQLAKIFTYLHVKEDAQTLYGFSTEDEKSVFLKLIGVSGIGPATGIGMLSVLSAKEIKDAIASGDNKTIQSIKGIGVKTAQRVVLELKDKFAQDADYAESSTASPLGALAVKVQIREEAIAALTALGIGRPQAEKNVKSILSSASKELSVEEVIKLALKNN